MGSSGLPRHNNGCALSRRAPGRGCARTGYDGIDGAVFLLCRGIASGGLPGMGPNGRSEGLWSVEGGMRLLVVGAILICAVAGILGALAWLSRPGPSTGTSSPEASPQCLRSSLALPSAEESHAAYLPSSPAQLSPGPSLAPDAPSLPVPPGSVLLNAQIEGSGPSAYRLVAWWSGAGYNDTVTFYGGLSDQRWHGSGSSATPQAGVHVLGRFGDILGRARGGRSN